MRSIAGWGCLTHPPKRSSGDGVAADSPTLTAARSSLPVKGREAFQRGRAPPAAAGAWAESSGGGSSAAGSRSSRAAQSIWSAFTAP